MSMENTRLDDAANAKNKADAVVDEANQAAVDTTPQEAGDASQQATTSIESVATTVDDALNADLESDKNGNPGISAPKRNTVFGAAKTMGADALTAKTRSLPMPHVDSPIISDVDRFDRDTRGAETAYDQVVAQLDFEATRAAEDGVTQIVGEAANNSVYSLESDIIEDTLSGETAKYPLGHPRSRSHGTIFAQKPEFLDVSGSYIEGVHNKPEEPDRVLLNELDQNGRVVPGHFIAPRFGKFWLRGINPFVPANADHSKNGPLEASVVDGNTADFDSVFVPNGYAEDKYAITVSYPSTKNDAYKLFDVVDLTPTYRDIDCCVAEMRKYARANKTRMRKGLFDTLETLCNNVMLTLTEEDKLAFPELNSSMSRCSLFAGEKEYGYATAGIACNNEVSDVLKLMHAINQSDVVWSMIWANVRNAGLDLPFMKGFEGANSSKPYYHDHSGKSTRQVAIGAHSDASRDIHLPNLVPYARSLSSKNAFKTDGRWVYGFKDFHARIKTIKTLLGEDESMKSLLKHVYTLEHSVQVLNSVFSYGRVTDSEGMTSNAVCKLPGTFDVLLDFDPNSFVDYDNSGATTKWYAKAGYVNILGEFDAKMAQIHTYSVVPTWVESLLSYFKTTAFADLVCQDLSSTEYSFSEASSHGTLLHWLLQSGIHASGRNFIQIQADCFKGSLFPFMLAEAWLNTEATNFGRNRTINAVTNRFPAILDKIGYEAACRQHYDQDLYSAVDAVMNNPDFDLNVRAQRISNLPRVYDFARDRFLNEDGYYLGYVELYEDGDGLLNTADYLDAYVKVPHMYRRWIQNLKGLTLHEVATDCVGLYGDVIDTSDVPVGAENILSVIRQHYSGYDAAVAAAKEGDVIAIPTILVRLGDVQRADGQSAVHDLLATVPVPQFGADEAFLGNPMDVEGNIYGRDTHFFNEGDAYIFLVEVGAYIADEQTCNDRYTNIMLAPVVVDKNSTSGKVYTAVPRAVSFKFGPNKTLEIVTTGANRDDWRIRAAIRPSLYGSDIQCLGGLTVVSEQMNARQPVATLEQSALMPDKIVYAYQMEIAGVDFSGATDPTDLSGSYGVRGATDLGDPKTLYRQRLFTNYWEPTEIGKNRFKLSSFFNFGNFILSCPIHGTKRVSVARTVAYDDALKRILDYRHAGFFGCHVDAIEHGHGSRPYWFVTSPDDHCALEVLSKDAVNDVRRFNYGKPMAYYNRKWDSYAMLTSLLYNQYMKRH